MDTETTPVTVTLLSGKTLVLQMPPEATMRHVQFEVEKKLQLSLSKLLYVSETPAELDASTMLLSLALPVSFTAVALPDRIAATCDSFAYLQEDGQVSTWSVAAGSNDREVYRLQAVKAIQSTDHAFSAIKFDGTVISWGDLEACRGNLQVRHQLHDVQEVQATAFAFAAIRTDGSVVTWPVEGEGARFGGDSDSVQNQLRSVRAIQASRRAFAALKTDGTVVTWGAPEAGGDSRPVQAQLRNVKCIQANTHAFAALREDGRVFSWPLGKGISRGKGCSSISAESLLGVKAIQGTAKAFAGIRTDGTVVAWGDPDLGGSCSRMWSLYKQLSVHLLLFGLTGQSSHGRLVGAKKRSGKDVVGTAAVSVASSMMFGQSKAHSVHLPLCDLMEQWLLGVMQEKAVTYQKCGATSARWSNFKRPRMHLQRYGLMEVSLSGHVLAAVFKAAQPSALCNHLQNFLPL